MRLCYLRREILQLKHRREGIAAKEDGLKDDAERKNRHQGYRSWYAGGRFLLIYVPNSER